MPPKHQFGTINPEAPSSHREYAATLLNELSRTAINAHYGSGVSTSIELQNGFSCDSVIYYLEHLIGDYPILDENTISCWTPDTQHLFVQADKRRLELPHYHRPITWLPMSAASAPFEDAYKAPPRQFFEVNIVEPRRGR